MQPKPSSCSTSTTSATGFISYRVHVFADQTEEQLFKDEHGVTTTPQVFLEGRRIGGYDELANHFGEQPES